MIDRRPSQGGQDRAAGRRGDPDGGAEALEEFDARQAAAGAAGRAAAAEQPVDPAGRGEGAVVVQRPLVVDPRRHGPGLPELRRSDR